MTSLEPPTFPRPPKGITPERFYCEYAPALARALLQTRALPNATWQLEIVIGDGEHFSVSFGPAGLACASGTAPTPLGLIRCTTAHWRALVGDFLPRLLRYCEKNWPRVSTGIDHAVALLSRIDAASLRGKPGCIDVQYTDDAGDAAVLSLAIGSGQGPRARVAVSDDELWPILDSGMRITKLVTSKLSIEGDAQYVLLIATSVDV